MLYDIIKSTPNVNPLIDSRNWQGIQDLLANNLVDITNDKAWTLGDVMSEIGEADARIVLSTLDTLGESDGIIKAARDAFVSTGLRLDMPDRQTMIDQVAAAGSWSDDLTAKVKKLGLEQKPQVVAAIGYLPEVDQIEQACDENAVSVYDKRGVQLSFNKQADGRTQINVRLTQYGTTVNGKLAKGLVSSNSTADASKPVDSPSFQNLINGINSVVDAYIAAEG